VFENFERRRLRPGDVDINYAIGGRGPPVLLLRFLRVGAAWRKRCLNVAAQTLPGGHFFIDQLPQDMARVLSAFLKG
jgi:hypothetical protein